jgi:hypothetical protein
MKTSHTGKRNETCVLLTQAVLIFNLIYFTPLKFNDVIAPSWCQALGWLMTISPLVIIVIVALYKLITHLKKPNVEHLSCCRVC